MSAFHKSAKAAQERFDTYIRPVLEGAGIRINLKINPSDLEYPLPTNNPKWNSIANRLCAGDGGAGLLHRFFLNGNHRTGIIVQPWVLKFKDARSTNRPCFNIPSDATFEMTKKALENLNIYQLTIVLKGKDPYQYWLCRYVDIPNKYWKTTWRTNPNKHDRIVFSSSIHKRVPVGKQNQKLIVSIKQEIAKFNHTQKELINENQQAGTNQSTGNRQARPRQQGNDRTKHQLCFYGWTSGNLQR